MDNILQITYQIVLLICLIYAIVKVLKFGVHAQNAFVFYIAAVVLIETIMFPIFGLQKYHMHLLYNLGAIAFIITIGIFYSYEWKKKIHQYLHIVVSIIAICLMVYYLISSENKSIFIKSIGNILVAYYLFCGLHWFYYQINYPDANKITMKLPFWVSTSLLFWCIIFIFRMVLMNYLSSSDPGFLTFLQYSLNIVNIIVYLFYCKGLSCLP